MGFGGLKNKIQIPNLDIL